MNAVLSVDGMVPINEETIPLRACFSGVNQFSRIFFMARGFIFPRQKGRHYSMK